MSTERACCVYCDEEIEASGHNNVYVITASDAYGMPVGFQRMHVECRVRMFAGSAAHILGDCSCYGGHREDPPGVSRREAARLALDALRMVRKPDP